MSTAAFAEITVKKAQFGKMSDGGIADIYTISNTNGVEVRITNFGAALVSLKTADRQNKLQDIVLGYDSLDGYLKDTFYIGGIVGRYGNRIAKGRFSLDNIQYKLAVNNGENHLHGGVKGFNKVIWTADSFSSAKNVGVKLKYLSRDGEEGYPGNLTVTVVYTLNDENELKIDYSAVTDKTTVLNLTNHSYFNLAGSGSILNHQLQIYADKFIPTDSGSIPTGEIRSVAESPFDFRLLTIIGDRINQSDEQLKFANGYDNNFVLNKKKFSELSLAAQAYEPKSGRTLEVYTTEPGIQFYSGNFLADVVGKNGKTYQRREAFCLETQHFPDSPNQTAFPTTILKKNQKFSSQTIYKFAAR